MENRKLLNVIIICFLGCYLLTGCNENDPKKDDQLVVINDNEETSNTKDQKKQKTNKTIIVEIFNEESDTEKELDTSLSENIEQITKNFIMQNPTEEPTINFKIETSAMLNNEILNPEEDTNTIKHIIDSIANDEKNADTKNHFKKEFDKLCKQMDGLLKNNDYSTSVLSTRVLSDYNMLNDLQEEVYKLVGNDNKFLLAFSSIRNPLDPSEKVNLSAELSYLNQFPIPVAVSTPITTVYYAMVATSIGDTCSLFNFDNRINGTGTVNGKSVWDGNVFLSFKNGITGDNTYVQGTKTTPNEVEAVNTTEGVSENKPATVQKSSRSITISATR